MLENNTFPELAKVGYEISHELAKHAHIIVLDDDDPLYDKYGSGQIPCFIIIKNGEIKDTFYGYINSKQLAEKINKVVNNV